MEKLFLVKVDNTPIFNFVISKSTTIKSIKSYFSKEYPYYFIRFFINSTSEVKAFYNKKYENLTMKSCWDKIEDGYISLYKNIILTGIKDIDRKIVNHLNDRNLFSFIQTCKYAHHLTREDIFWYNRFIIYYKMYEKYKPENINWYSNYSRIKRRCSSTLKIVVVGETMCGKTSFIHRLNNRLIFHHSPTLGVEVDLVQVNNRIFNMWDCAGDERFTGLGDGYYFNSEGAIIMCSADSPTSILKIESLTRDLKRVGDFPIVVVVNKCELLSNEQLLALSQSQPDFIFISCLNDINLSKVFERF